MQNDLFTKEEQDAWNTYFYPNTDVFINNLGIKDNKELDKKEAEITFERLVELNENPIVGNFDSNHLIEIHKYIFQDLYPWAGKYRTVHTGKNNSSFCDYKEIDQRLKYELNLMNEDTKNVSNIDMFKNLIADYFIVLLNIHPFRDGNGRSIREFLREFTVVKTRALNLGEYNLDWSLVSEEELDKYMPLARFIKSPIEILISKAIVEDKTKSI